MVKEIKDVLSTNYPEMEWVLMDTPTNKVEFEEYFIVHKLGSHKKPTWEELETQLVDMQAEWDSQDYTRKRRLEYPSISECVHAILDGELDALQAKRKIVKERHPKGGN
tara:strand:+ start:1321 stop:1647 length:327 start_codon:yes stop_codon:yes gene_type:complete